jgi:hypothetical protein
MLTLAPITLCAPRATPPVGSRVVGDGGAGLFRSTPGMRYG